MDIRMLKELVLLVETLSFRETADQMNISQSALTKHVHRIEKELGVSLFDRTTRSVSLNQFSRAYYPYAKQIVKLSEEADAGIAALQSHDAGELRVMFTPGAAPYGIVDYLSQFSREHPEYQLRLAETPYIAKLLDANRCDFAFSEENDCIDSHMNRLLYSVDELVVILPASHPLAGRDRVTVDQLRQEKFIFHRSIAGAPLLSTQKFRELCKAHGFEPTVFASACFISTILELVTQGQGITVLQRRRVPAAAGVVIAELEPVARTCVYALYLTKKKLTPAARAFLRYLNRPR